MLCDDHEQVISDCGKWNTAHIFISLAAFAKLLVFDKYMKYCNSITGMQSSFVGKSATYVSLTGTQLKVIYLLDS